MAQLTPIRGFSNTPVSRSVCIITTVLALSLSIFQLKHYVKLAIDPYIIEYSQYWRIVTYQLCVINESDYLLVILLWFHFKNLERFYGSRKYLSIISIFALYNSLVCFILLSLGQLALSFLIYLMKSLVIGSAQGVLYQNTFFNEVIPGPMGIISSLYIAYTNYIPVSYHFKILLSNPFKGTSESQENLDEQRSKSKELIFTNHFQIHIVYTLLLLNNGTRSLFPCLIGLLTGKLYTQDLLPGAKNWLLPTSIFRFFINPQKCIGSSYTSIRNILSGGYLRINDESINDVNTNTSSNDDNNNIIEEDNEEILDENRNNATQIRAETPIRPLGSQFLDTFRT